MIERLMPIVMDDLMDQWCLPALIDDVVWLQAGEDWLCGSLAPAKDSVSTLDRAAASAASATKLPIATLSALISQYQENCAGARPWLKMKEMQEWWPTDNSVTCVAQPPCVSVACNHWVAVLHQRLLSPRRSGHRRTTTTCCGATAATTTTTSAWC